MSEETAGPVTVTGTVDVSLDITVRQLAELFWSLDSDEMAEFFTQVGRLTQPGELAFQLSYVSDSECLFSDGRYVMNLIGEYAETGA